MGFFDNLRDSIQDRLNPGARDDYYDDADGYEDEYFDDSADEPRARSERRRDEGGSGLLGNPSRPEADSVSVYTRSGRHLASDDGRPEAARGAAYADDYRDASSRYDDGAYRAADDSWRASAEPRAGFAERTEPEGAYVPPLPQPGVFGATGNTPGDVGLTAHPRASSGKLPPYVLKPTSYDDVQMVIRRVRTNQPVVLSFKSIKIETAKRILDFCFGLACGVDGSVEELGDKVFVVLPQGITLADSDVAKLKGDGLLK